MTTTISQAQNKANIANNRAIQAQKRSQENIKRNASTFGTITRQGKVIYDPITGRAIGTTYTDISSGLTTTTFEPGKSEGEVRQGGYAFNIKRGQPALSPAELKQAAGQKLGRADKEQLRNVLRKRQPQKEQPRYEDLYFSRQNRQSESKPTDDGGRGISTQYNQMSIYKPIQFAKYQDKYLKTKNLTSETIPVDSSGRKISTQEQ